MSTYETLLCVDKAADYRAHSLPDPLHPFFLLFLSLEEALL